MQAGANGTFGHSSCPNVTFAQNRKGPSGYPAVKGAFRKLESPNVTFSPGLRPAAPSDCGRDAGAL
jgi:hypothetical protein